MNYESKLELAIRTYKSKVEEITATRLNDEEIRALLDINGPTVIGGTLLSQIGGMLLSQKSVDYSAITTMALLAQKGILGGSFSEDNLDKVQQISHYICFKILDNERKVEELPREIYRATERDYLHIDNELRIKQEGLIDYIRSSAVV